MRHKLLSTISALLLSLSSTSAFSQAVGCDFDAGFKAFDFWIGEWNVFDNSSGKQAGSNTIESREGGCLLLESWVSINGGTGTSLNYYNPLTEQWRQLWVSAGRYSIDIAGGMEQGSMVLVGKITNFAGGAADFRGKWTPNDDGSVRQFFEQYNSETKTWNAWFDGNYVRK